MPVLPLDRGASVPWNTLRLGLAYSSGGRRGKGYANQEHTDEKAAKHCFNRTKYHPGCSQIPAFLMGALRDLSSSNPANQGCWGAEKGATDSIAQTSKQTDYRQHDAQNGHPIR
jgi:hypothetical protein